MMIKQASPRIVKTTKADKEMQAVVDTLNRAENRESFVPEKRCGKDYTAKTFRICVDSGWLQSIADLTPAERGYALKRFVADRGKP